VTMLIYRVNLLKGGEIEEVFAAGETTEEVLSVVRVYKTDAVISEFALFASSTKIDESIPLLLATKQNESEILTPFN